MTDKRAFRNYNPAPGGVLQGQEPAVAHRRKAKLDRKLEDEKIEENLDVILDNVVVSGSLQHAGTLLAFYGGTAVVQPGAYTQTWAVSDKTHAAPTAVALTHAFGTADGTVTDVGGAFNQTTLNDNFKELTTQVAALVADLADVKALVNAVIDDLQVLSLVDS